MIVDNIRTGLFKKHYLIILLNNVFFPQRYIYFFNLEVINRNHGSWNLRQLNYRRKNVS